MISIKDEDKASISLKKILSICLIFMFLSGICVMAADTKINNVKITLSNDYEMNVVTSKNKVSEILEEKHIILLPDEKVEPGLNDEIDSSKEIKICKMSEQEEVIEIAETNSELTMDQILKAYSPIVEKIVLEQVSIPFETITKDVSNGSAEKTNKVLQEGKEGLKEVTCKIKYQNEVEIERTEISSIIISEPVNKVIQLNKKATVTSRSGSIDRTASAQTTSATGTSLGKYKITAYCSCSKCCGKSNAMTASGTRATANHTIAAPGNFPIGTKLKINGIVYTVEDRGGAIKGKKIDIYVNSHEQALKWGVKHLDVEILN